MSGDRSAPVPSAADGEPEARRVRLVVVGDGPAGSALAAEATDRLGPDEVLLVGGDEPWRATYGAWVDELESPDGRITDASSVAVIVPELRAWFGDAGETVLDRRYAVVSNRALRSRLRQGVSHRIGLVSRVTAVSGGRREVVVDGHPITADLVVDATGWPSRLTASDRTEPSPMGWQTAWGVVTADPPPGRFGVPTLMDWSPPGGTDHDVPTFAYALPVDDGWLVEETVLASMPPVDPRDLRPVLARRLGVSTAELDSTAIRVEQVRIPMGAPLPPRRAADPTAPVVRFGAAAGYAHPATGYQLSAALSAAPDVAALVVQALDDEPERRDQAVAAAVWPTSRRRTRRLHEFGLDVVLGLDAASTRRFFATFFSLPSDVWAAQLRVDTPPAQVAAVMARIFRAAPWALRRELVAGDPRRLARVVRP